MLIVDSNQQSKVSNQQLDLEAPHSIAFKCTPEGFGELIERPGIIPAPYMARNMWVQEQGLGETLDRRELAPLIRTSYELVVAKLPRSKRPGADRGLTRSPIRGVRNHKVHKSRKG
jgi:predicted DNA-binding protein (MmcQ/YjbR family)